MPAVVLYGRRWHFSADALPLPAALAAFYHLGWWLALLISALAIDGLPDTPCAADPYVVLYWLFFTVLLIYLILDIALMWASLQGAPLEVSKRWAVEPILYIGTLPFLIMLGATCYGTYVVSGLDPKADCWPDDKIDEIQTFGRVFIFTNWVFFFLAFLGMVTVYNAFPQHEEIDSWEERCECIAAVMCCRQQIKTSPDKGKRPPLKNIAELTAGLLSHIDLTPDDITTALILCSAAQNRRRRLRVARALKTLLPHLQQEGLEDNGRNVESPRGEDDGSDDKSSSRSEEMGPESSGTTTRDTTFLAGVPSDRHLTLQLRQAQEKSVGIEQHQQQQNNQEVEDNYTPPASQPETKGGKDDQQQQHPEREAEEGKSRLEEMVKEAVEELGVELKEVSVQDETSLSIVTVDKGTSMDLSALKIDPDNPQIWFTPEKAAAAKAAAAIAASSAASIATSEESDGSDEQPKLVVTIQGRNSQNETNNKNTDDEAHKPTDGEDDQNTRKQGIHAEVIPMERQITLQFPSIITPSELAVTQEGPLTPEMLTEVYAGRHEHVGAETLSNAIHFLKYAYAVYSLEPSLEKQSTMSALDFVCWWRRPQDIMQTIFKSMNELEKLEDKKSVDILITNCSNRVLAHLPYMIALDHSKRAVVIAIRGTISLSDLITDAVVAPESITEWLPDDVRRKCGNAPALAHAGMVASAKAIFRDMKARELLQELVESESPSDYTHSPEEQSHMNRDDNHKSSRLVRQRRHQGDIDCGYNYAANVASSSKNTTPDTRIDEHENTTTTTTAATENRDSTGAAAGRKIGVLMREKVLQDGWQLIVTGHSLGAGCATLLSLKLRQHYPNLKCIAYSCPGALLNKELSNACASFVTSVIVGKDAVPRATVGTLGRLMDEMVTALARCRQPKIQVILLPWFKHRHRDFASLFYDYSEIPNEALQILLRYYESRKALGRPVPTVVPGRVLFLRPLKTRASLEWDAVWITPADLLAEGLLLSPNMLRHHQCDVALDALKCALDRVENRKRKGRMHELILKAFGGGLNRRHLRRGGGGQEEGDGQGRRQMDVRGDDLV